MLEDNLDNFSSIENRIFFEDKGKIYIGGEEVKPDVLDVLREQARYFETSQLYEVLRATIINEAYDMALKQSGKSGDLLADVNTAKMLYHWQFVLDSILFKLKRK